MESAVGEGRSRSRRWLAFLKYQRTGALSRVLDTERGGLPTDRAIAAVLEPTLTPAAAEALRAPLRA